MAGRAPAIGERIAAEVQKGFFKISRGSGWAFPEPLEKNIKI
jgi:hypothetical protein